MSSLAAIETEIPRPAAIPVRGVTPLILLSQVKNTVPYLFEPGLDPKIANLPFLAPLLALDQASNAGKACEPSDYAHADYFSLCLGAHYTTVASFVPTDVDNQIRFRLWNPQLDVNAVISMAELVVESLRWDSRPVSARSAVSPRTGEWISGHHGEWFSTAVGAYAAVKKRNHESSKEILELILSECDREKAVFEDLKKARDGIGLLKASTVIAHNLGDLDRVIEMWSLPETDPLRAKAFKLGHKASERFGSTLFDAGELNKLWMSDENHRHFALRRPRVLRKSSDFLLPIGPFFDDWGGTLCSALRARMITAEEVADVVEALVEGWEWLKKAKSQAKTPVSRHPAGDGPFGYARAIAGILDHFPGGFQSLSKYLPARLGRDLKAGTLRTLCDQPRKRFEDLWNRGALK